MLNESQVRCTVLNSEEEMNRLYFSTVTIRLRRRRGKTNMMDDAAREEYQREYQRKLDALSEYTYLDPFFRCPQCDGNVGVVVLDGYPNKQPYYQCARRGECPHDTFYSVERYDAAVFRVLDYFYDSRETIDALIHAWIEDQNKGNWDDTDQHQAEMDALLRPRYPHNSSKGAEIGSHIGSFLGGWEHDGTRIDYRTRWLEQQQALGNIVDHIHFRAHGICIYFHHLDIPIEVIVEPAEECKPVFFPALEGDIEVKVFLFHQDRQKGVTKTIRVFGKQLTFDVPANLKYHQKLRLRNAATLPGESEPLRNVIVRL
jgi:hypothetical protein